MLLLPHRERDHALADAVDTEVRLALERSIAKVQLQGQWEPSGFPPSSFIELPQGPLASVGPAEAQSGSGWHHPKPYPACIDPHESACIERLPATHH